jgi:hypothetical protein
MPKIRRKICTTHMQILPFSNVIMVLRYINHWYICFKVKPTATHGLRPPHQKL